MSLKDSFLFLILLRKFYIRVEGVRQNIETKLSVVSDVKGNGKTGRERARENGFEKIMMTTCP